MHIKIALLWDNGTVGTNFTINQARIFLMEAFANNTDSWLGHCHDRFTLCRHDRAMEWAVDGACIL